MNQPLPAGRSLRIAYLINQYPAVSHSFIRREILALERAGVHVQRTALRSWADNVAADDDPSERERTRHVLAGGAVALIVGLLRMLVTRPWRVMRALGQALHMARGSDRALFYHLIYLLEACVVAHWIDDDGSSHLHAHFGTNSAEVAMLAAGLVGIPFSFTVRGPEEFDRPQAIGLPRKMSRAAFVVAVSSFGRSQLMRWINHDRWSTLHVVHCGVDRAFFEGSVPDSPAPALPRLVCVGRICEQKGQLLLLTAMRRVLDRGVAFELVLAGDGDMREEVERLMRSLALDTHVRITGWIGGGHVRDELLSARALVLPRFAEGLPVVIMGAMALRRPVISTYVAGIPELVIPGESGWLVPAGDVDALADAMESCLRSSQGALDAMGEAAHRRALARHDIDVEAAKLVHLFGAVGERHATELAA